MTKETDEDIVKEARERFQLCEEWEAQARRNYEYDVKFANGDPINNFQWPADVLQRRILEQRPCLTVNKAAQHNLQIINDGKQNKPGVNIRPVGESASFEAAQVFQEVVRHIEYISNAENVYDHATVTQVNGGIGYWRVCVDWISPTSFEQEIYIRRVKDPRYVYLDPDINEADGSDARFGFAFEDMPRDLFNEKHPKFKNEIGWQTHFDPMINRWINRKTVRVAEYYRRVQKSEIAVSFIGPNGDRIETFKSKLTPELKEWYEYTKEREGNLPEEERTWRERDTTTDVIEWYKIAGNKIIERGPWLGKYVPIIRCVGTETVIDGVLDRKGHTRALISAQQMYNYQTSANVEFGALQTKAPWLAPLKAIEGLEAYWKTANTANHSVLPWNNVDDDGKDIPPPSRPLPPQPSPAYVEGMQIAQNEMMMASGQWQSQMGENENAKSGVAINARQRQGDRATYHFIDNLAIAIRYTGKILIDLIPKIYDTPRVRRISASDGSIMEVRIDPTLKDENGNPIPYKKVQPEGMPDMDKNQEMAQIIFNPTVGIYDVQSEVGPSFATKRQEAFNALTQIAAQNKEFMGIAGDVLWKVADFPEAQVLMERWRKIIPKNITGEAIDPVIEQAMQQAADKIEQMAAIIAQQAQEIANKDKEYALKDREVKLAEKKADQDRETKDYDAKTKRLTAAGNSGPAISRNEIMPIVRQLIQEMLEDKNDLDDEPPVEGARKAADGNWYVEHEPGKYARVDVNAE